MRGVGTSRSLRIGGDIRRANMAASHSSTILKDNIENCSRRTGKFPEGGTICANLYEKPWNGILGSRGRGDLVQ